jgi:hypothetical protein
MPKLLPSPLSPFQLLIPLSNRQTPNPILKDWPVELRCNRLGNWLSEDFNSAFRLRVALVAYISTATAIRSIIIYEAAGLSHFVKNFPLLSSGFKDVSAGNCVVVSLYTNSCHIHLRACSLLRRLRVTRRPSRFPPPIPLCIIASLPSVLSPPTCVESEPF